MKTLADRLIKRYGDKYLFEGDDSIFRVLSSILFEVVGTNKVYTLQDGSSLVFTAEGIMLAQ